MRFAKKTMIAFVALLLIGSSAANAQFETNVSKVGTVAASFLEIGVGARAIGMGGAYAAISNDVSGIYWNPAGTALMKHGEAGFVHTEWVADISYDNIATIIPMGNGMVIGGFVTTVGMDEMEVRTVEMPEGTGEFFRTSNFAFGLTYGMRLTDRLSLGANAKYIREQIWHMNASTMALDMGLLFKTPFKDLNIGMSISNFGPDMQMKGHDASVNHDIDPNNPGNNEDIRASLDTEKWSLPLTFRVGLSMPVYKGVNDQFLVAVDAVHPNDNYEYLNLGGEWSWREWAFLRAGWKTLFLDDTEQGFTAGVGMKFSVQGNVKFIMDVAYADFGRLDQVVRYSLGLQF